MTVIVSDPIYKSTKIGRYANNLPLFFAVLKSFTIFANGTIIVEPLKPQMPMG